MKGVLKELCNGPLADATDLEEAKQLVLAAIEPTKIPQRDKKRLIFTVQQCTSLTSLQSYCYNAMLKFNGQGVIHIE